VIERSPTVTFASSPESPRGLTNFFDVGPGTVSALVERPGTFRYAGWNLETLDSARLVDGAYWEVRNGERKHLRVSENGEVVFRALADSSFLGWGRDEGDFQQRPRLNSIALVEVTASFVYFIADLLPHFSSSPGRINVLIAIENARIGSNYLYVVPGKTNSVAWISDSPKYPLRKESAELRITLDAANLVADRDAAAYLIVERLFAQFSMPPKDVPYVDLNQPRRVDVKGIREIR
jgi:hypothetical protein